MARLAIRRRAFLDVSTGGELHVALAAGVPPTSIVLHGNNKDEAELATAIALRGRAHRRRLVRRDRQARCTACGTRRTVTSRVGVLVRVTPGVEAHTHEFVRTGQEDSKFGFGLASGAAAAAVERLRSMPGVELLGVHAHIGSQIFRAESFAEAVEVARRVRRTRSGFPSCASAAASVSLT